MQLRTELRATRTPAGWALVVTYMGPLGFGRGWTSQHASEASARSEQLVALTAARKARVVGHYQPPTHGRIRARAS